ncbi:hypothetical protein [Streptomyces sp. NL15-2K]|nr:MULTISPECIES: hypothetical protein [Actinomycetes]WKX13918.1 hypothetical protein Q4V64_42895 [Kutzneria buriramensis]GCB50896.1 hypothetical protein SNL152K_8243 [Streptomyces sp. NL15-2K]
MADLKGHVAVDCLVRSLHRRVTLVWDDDGYVGQLINWGVLSSSH